MTGTKRKGRPVTREAPAAGKRTQLSVAISQPLKRQLVKEAKANGRSISAETEYRLQMSFSGSITQGVLRPVRAELTQPLGTWSGPRRYREEEERVDMRGTITKRGKTWLLKFEGPRIDGKRRPALCHGQRHAAGRTERTDEAPRRGRHQQAARSHA